MNWNIAGTKKNSYLEVKSVSGACIYLEQQTKLEILQSIICFM